MTRNAPVRLATRASRLAMIQAKVVADRLSAAGVHAVLVEVATAGDADARPLRSIGGRGVFTKALEEAVLDGRADAAVHSAKDLPTTLPEGLVLAAALERGDVRDVLVSAGGFILAELPAASVVGTSSARRAATVRRLRGDLETRDIRGNVPTRVEKVLRGEYDAAILAAAGLRRLGMENSITEAFETDIMLPAAGQAAIVVETAASGEAYEILAGLSHSATFSCVAAERAVLSALGAGCRAAVGALAVPEGNAFRLRSEVLSADGARRWRGEVRFEAGGEKEAGAALAQSLLDDGAGEALAGGA